MTPRDHFFSAPFAFDGESQGIGEWELSALSPRWLDVCEQLLRQHGPVFRTSLGHKLSHLEIELTSARGAGIGTFRAHNRVVISTGYLRGQDAVADSEVVQMLINSLRRVPIVQSAKSTPSPFEEMKSIVERPIHLIVAWADPNVSEQDEELVRELANHFAAAYLCRYDG